MRFGFYREGAIRGRRPSPFAVGFLPYKQESVQSDGLYILSKPSEIIRWSNGRPVTQTSAQH